MSRPHPSETPARDSQGPPPTEPRSAPSAPGTPPGSLDPLLESKAAILGVLFTVTGVLGLPLLWYSPRFSPRERWIWAVVVTLYTLLLIALVVWVLQWSYRQLVG